MGVLWFFFKRFLFLRVVWLYNLGLIIKFLDSILIFFDISQVTYQIFRLLYKFGEFEVFNIFYCFFPLDFCNFHLRLFRIKSLIIIWILFELIQESLDLGKSTRSLLILRLLILGLKIPVKLCITSFKSRFPYKSITLNRSILNFFIVFFLLIFHI